MVGYGTRLGGTSSFWLDGWRGRVGATLVSALPGDGNADRNWSAGRSAGRGAGVLFALRMYQSLPLGNGSHGIEISGW